MCASTTRAIPLLLGGSRPIEELRETSRRTSERRRLWPPPPLRATTRYYSLAYLRRRTTERATTAWRRDIEKRNAGKRSFRLPTARSRPGIRRLLQAANKSVAGRFFQLLSGHAVLAPFLKDGWG